MIESTYRVDASRSKRGISGVSMGGYGALKIAFKNPQLFGSVSAHSPVLVSNLTDADCAWTATRYVRRPVRPDLRHQAGHDLLGCE